MTIIRHAIILAVLCLLAQLWPTARDACAAPGENAGGRAFVLTVDGAIGPATRDHIVRGIARAEGEGAELVVLRMNTPGGLDASMRDIIRKILASNVPVATWVAPSGSRAASAGTYIMYASHIAAMAPATNLGAATPVQIGGGEEESPLERLRDKLKTEGQEDGENATAEQEVPAGGAMERKIVNDASAYIRGLAERHGRNAVWAERAVREAVSLTAEEALEQKVIDVVAADLPRLLDAIDGREVRMDEGTRILRTAGLTVEEIDTDWRTELLAIITNPTLAYIFLMVGIYGLILEGLHPGALLPGVTGGISLLLALYAFQILPVNYAGLALILLGLALATVELFVPSFGVLGIGGIVGVVFGSVILFEGDQGLFSVNTSLIAGIALVSILVFCVVAWVAVRSLRKPRPDSSQAMSGLMAEAVSDFTDGKGRVHLRGENWFARSELPVRRGDTVRVISMDAEGLVLKVTPEDPISGEDNT